MDVEWEQNPGNLPTTATEAGFLPVPHFFPSPWSHSRRCHTRLLTRCCIRTSPDPMAAPQPLTSGCNREGSAICTENTNAEGLRAT